MIFAIVLLAILYFLGKKQGKKFNKEINELAQKINFEYKQKNDPEILKLVQSFTHDYLKKSLMVNKILKGEISGVNIIVSECSYRIGKGKNEFPVFIFMHESLALPKLIIESESYLDKIIAKMDIDFSSHPEFSKKFKLHGEDEYKIKKILNEEFLSIYEELKFTQCMETTDGKVIFFDFTESYKPKKIPDKLKTYVRLITLMKKGN